MHTQSDRKDPDRTLQFTRLQLWTALLLLLLLSVFSAVLAFSPGSPAAAMASHAAKLIPVVIVIAVVALKTRERRQGLSGGAAVKAQVDDELRQMSLAKAYRNAFFGVLAFQPVIMLAITFLSPFYPAALMATLTIAVGLLVMLGSVLFYDR